LSEPSFKIANLGKIFLGIPSARKNHPETTIALLSVSGRLRSISANCRSRRSIPLQAVNEHFEGFQVMLRSNSDAFHVNGEKLSPSQREIGRKHTASFLFSTGVEQTEGVAIFERLRRFWLDKPIT
jgi:hypothetical protein